MKKIIIGISGASGADLGIRFARVMLENNSNIFAYIIISNGAKIALNAEKNFESTNIFKKELKNLESRFEMLDNNFIEAPISSGSFKTDSMIIAPCSANTLAKIASGISDNLITRAAQVCLKERRDLILAPREMPFDSIMLKNMLFLSKLGVVISPPILGYYSEIKDLNGMERFLFGKWLNSLHIEHSLFKPWGSK